VQTRFTGPTTHLIFDAGKKAHFDKATEAKVPTVTPEWVTQYVAPRLQRFFAGEINLSRDQWLIISSGATRCEKEKKLLAANKFTAELGGGGKGGAAAKDKKEAAGAKAKPAAANGKGAAAKANGGAETDSAAAKKEEEAKKKKAEEANKNEADKKEKTAAAAAKGKKEDDNVELDDEEVTTDDEGRSKKAAEGTTPTPLVFSAFCCWAEASDG
jgi:hypothetical protein